LIDLFRLRRLGDAYLHLAGHGLHHLLHLWIGRHGGHGAERHFDIGFSLFVDGVEPVLVQPQDHHVLRAVGAHFALCDPGGDHLLFGRSGHAHHLHRIGVAFAFHGNVGIRQARKCQQPHQTNHIPFSHRLLPSFKNAST